MVHGIGNERERRSELVADVGEEHELRFGHLLDFGGELSLPLVALLQLLAEARLGEVGPVGVGAEGDEQEDDDDEGDERHVLVVEHGERVVNLLVQLVEVLLLALHLLVLHQQHVGIFLGDEGSLEGIVFLVVLLL